MLYDNSFLQKGKPFPPEDEIDRITLYNQNRLLFKGEHKQVFRERYNQLFDIDEQTIWQFDFNWYRRITTAFANLLFGEPPVFTINDSKKQAFLNHILQYNDFVNVGYNVAIDISRYGTGIFKPVLENGEVVIDALSPAYWFPIFDPTNGKKIVAHYIIWAIQDKLYVEIHDTQKPGIITNQVYKFDGQNIGDLISSTDTPTGVDKPLLVIANNLSGSESVFGVDDYTVIDTIVCELEVRFSQVARILDKHASPSMYGPRSLIQQDKRTGRPYVDVSGKYIGVGPGDTPPNYLVWDAKLNAVNEEIEKLMEQLYALSETSPALFGDIKTGLIQSGSAMRRMLISPLAKVNRLRLSLDRKIRDTLSLASELAVANRVPGAVLINPEDIHIEWKDGLPVDLAEEVMVESTALGAGLTSRESAIKRMWGLDGEALQKEIEKIDKERNVVKNPPKELKTIQDKLNKVQFNPITGSSNETI